MSTIQIQVFAALKTYFKHEFEITTPVATIEELRAELQKINPQASKLLQASRFAIKEEFVSPEYKLAPNDKVVVLPPSSGG